MAAWTADLDDLFTGVCEEGGEAGTVAAGPFENPTAPTRNVLMGELQQALVAAGVCGYVGGLQHGADGADGGCGERVTVGVDTDDAVDVFCEHGHAVVLLRADGPWSASAWVESPWRNCDESRRETAEKLLIKPTGGPGARVRQTSRGHGRP
ncbi:hypothetical protein GCM10023323_40320 [Streptomyces thinghirensis]|uniref:Uncharacterized protein n=1 Tax=Streptomyces thinghirensis TaxID=551547 RepID=A0ABP9T7X8_9ACTN